MPSKTYNNVSMQQSSSLKMLPPPPLWLALPPQMMTLKHPPPLYTFKCHKYDKYGKAPYLVPSYHQLHKANLRTVLTCSPQSEVTPPAFPKHTNEDILKCTFSKSARFTTRQIWKSSVIKASMYWLSFKILQKKAGFAWNSQSWGIVCREYFSNAIFYLYC